MTRAINSTYLVRGVVELLEPLRIGNTSDEPDIDIPLLVDGNGNYIVPGTTIAGACLSWMKERFSQEQKLIRTLWGFAVANEDEGAASLVEVYDLVFDAHVAQTVEYQSGVSIDRISGSAVSGALYSYALVPKGSIVNFRISFKIPNSKKKKRKRLKALIGYLIEALAAGEIGFGASRNSGFGGIRLQTTGLTILKQKRSAKNLLKIARVGLTAGLDERKPVGKKVNTRHLIGKTKLKPATAEKVTCQLFWKPTYAAFSKSDIAGSAVDILPQFSAINDEELALRISGNSWRGVIRSALECELRTVFACSPNVEVSAVGQILLVNKFKHQIQVPLVSLLFGTGADSSDESQSNDYDGKGPLSVGATYSQNLRIQRNQWEELTQIKREEKSKEISELRVLLDDIESGLDGVRLEQVFHVAIDRFTGAPVESHLYSELVPEGIVWEPLELNLDLGRLQEPDDKDMAVALLLMIVHLFHEQEISIGFGARRSFGSVFLSEVRLSTSVEKWQWLEDLQFVDGLFGEETESLDNLRSAWRSRLETTLCAEEVQK